MRVQQYRRILFLSLSLGVSSLKAQQNFRLIDPEDPGDRYGKPPSSSSPFLWLSSTTQYYNIADNEYDSHSAAVSASFSSWNSAAPVSYSSSASSGVSLETFSSSSGSPFPNPGSAYLDFNGSTYEIDSDNTSIELNTYFTWGIVQDLEDDFLDVQSILTHEIGHALGIAHPVTFTEGANAPTMAGGDNEYFWDHLDGRSLETEDINAAKFLQLRVPDIYSTVSSGVSAANTLGFGLVVARSGTYTESNNLTINSDVRLELHSGTTLQIASGKKITVNGTLLAQGSAGNRITFKQSSGTWYGIEVNSGADFHPRFCDFENVQTAIRYYNASGDVNNCTFTNYATALRYENSSSGRIEYSSMIDYGGTGIDAVQYAYPDARSYNAIEDNYYGVKGDNTSAPVLGYSAGGGYNSVVNAVWDVYSTNATTLYAVYNWWGSSSPSPNLYGDIVWQPYLSTNPLAKRSGQRQPRVALPTFAPDDTIGVSAFNQALRLYFAEDYATVLPLLQDLVSSYADYTIGRQALALESRVLAKLSRGTEALSRLNSVKQSNAGKEIAGLAHSLLVGLYIRNGDYAGAKVAAVEILQNHAGSDLEKYALYDLGLIHWYHFDDPKTGDSYFRQLIAAYPDDALAASARATLGEWQPESIAEEETPEPLVQKAGQLPTEFALLPNHPNPFNPTTVIRYGLPASGEVTLRIFDSLGREVRAWHLGVQAAGLHSVRWDGRDAAGEPVASGVYFYRLAFHPLAADNTPRLLQGKMSLLR